MGETLAMSNLGFALLRAGFVEEAQAICTKALGINGFHSNIGQLSTALRDNAKDETKSVTALLEGAKPRVTFYNLFGIALGLPELNGLPKTWTGPECEMILELTSSQVRFYGSYQRDANALSAALGLLSTKTPVRHEVDYKGVLSGRTVTGMLTRKSDEATASLLSGAGNPQRFLMVISESEILVLNDPASTVATPVSFKRRDFPWTPPANASEKL